MDEVKQRFPFERLTPLNRPAKLHPRAGETNYPDPYRVAGNPVSTLPDSAIANCFPGLEMDHRNLDRRFFPGLVFEFYDDTGAQLIAVDSDDPDLNSDLKEQMAAFAGKFQVADSWFLASIEQGSGEPIPMHDSKNEPLDGLIVWRMVRSLDRGDVTIVIKTRGSSAKEETFKAIRRRYIDDFGSLNAAFQSGELQQSLCSPWQHDFRDCTCLYWASNHPDIAVSPVPATRVDLERSNDEEAGSPMIMWLRRDRDPDALTLPFRKQDDNRPLEIDHYEINRRWQELNFVLEGREIESVYVPDDATAAPPLGLEELDNSLKEAAGIELALALEYLYAMYSLNGDVENREAQKDVLFARHELLAIAVSEMRHLRWANQIRQELRHAGILKGNCSPVLSAAKRVPWGSGTATSSYRDTKMRVISQESLEDFLGAERPSGTIHGLYAQIYSTLLQDKLKIPFISELASRIIADGVRHYSRFREIRGILGQYLRLEGDKQPSLQIIRNLDLRHEADSIYDSVRLLCQKVKECLAAGYSTGDSEDAVYIAKARVTMHQLDDECERIASLRNPAGVPFDKFFP